MPEIRSTREDPIQIFDALDFVTKQDVSPDEVDKPAYIIEGKDNYVIGIEKNTILGPRLIDTSGDKIDGSTRITFQKADPQGNPLGNAIIAQANMNQFDYEKMLSDPEYYKTTRKSLILDEREFLHVYLDIPEGSDDFDADASRLVIGDNVTESAKPVFIRQKQALDEPQKEAVRQASSQQG